MLSCRGEYQVPNRLPYTPGGEIAGVVSAVGEGVDLEVGTAVAVLGGGLREQNIVGAGSCFAYPTDALSPAQAAAIPVNYGTAWFGLHDRAKLQPGETVLITGAAGGTGTACIQIALAAGAVPIAIVGGEQKAALVRSLGVEHIVDHRETPDWVDTVREMSGGGVEDPNEFSEEIFSFRRITLAPLTVLLGYGVIFYSILKRFQPEQVEA